MFNEAAQDNATPEGRARIQVNQMKDRLRLQDEAIERQAKSLTLALGIIEEVAPHRLAEFGIAPQKEDGDAG